MRENIKAKSPEKGSGPKVETKKKEETSFFQPKIIQPSLKVGSPDDPFEQEADRVSAQFVQNHDMITGIQSKLPITGAMAQTLLQPKLSGIRINRKIHRSIQLSLFALLQAKCDDCEKEEEVQKKTSVFRSGNGDVVSPAIEQQINSSRGGGSSMDSNTKATMEAGLGADFSSVKIHTDSKAVQMSRDLNAHAFTVGSDVYFNEGKYQPGTREGKGLLAHELTHVVQQGQAVQKKSNSSSLLSNPAITNKVLGGDFAQNATLYRKEIGEFHKTNPSSDILMKQQELLQTKEAGGSISQDHSNTLRRCPDDPNSGGGTPAPKKTPKLKYTPAHAAKSFDCGGFNWPVKWSIENATTATDGWIVQKVELPHDVKDCAEKEVDLEKKPGLKPSWYTMWEAWQVRGGKVFIGGSKSPHGADTYGSPGPGDNTKGHLTVKGTADFYPGLTLPKSFKVLNAPPAHALPTTKVDPGLTGGTGSLDHSLTARWNCCRADKSTTVTTS